MFTGCSGRQMYAIIKVDVTERNDVTKRHSNVITIWRTSANEINIKNPRTEMKSMGVRVD